MGSAGRASTPSVQQTHPVVPNAAASTNSPRPQVSLNLRRSAQRDTKGHFFEPLEAPISQKHGRHLMHLK